MSKIRSKKQLILAALENLSNISSLRKVLAVIKLREWFEQRAIISLSGKGSDAKQQEIVQYLREYLYNTAWTESNKRPVMDFSFENIESITITKA